MKGTVWVIGASSGLGLATAQAFVRAGWQVIAGARSFGNGAQEQSPEEKEIRIHLDVTKDEDCAAFAREALALSPYVDALVYCAGLLVLGSCEETTSDEYARVMDTNFLGMTKMVAHVLPAMRKQRQGQIVLFSSINGVLGVPFQSAYTSSKHAIEGYAECLQMEVDASGISVCVVEPGDHQGGSQAYRLAAGAVRADSPYAAAYSNACAAIHHDEACGLHPDKLGDKVVRNVSRNRMRYRLIVAKPDQRFAVLLHTLLPRRRMLSILRGYYAKGRA